MRDRTLLFKEILFNMGVYMPNNTSELPNVELLYIPPIKKISKISSSYDSAPPT